MTKKIILVTGGLGLIGSTLISKLNEFEKELWRSLENKISLNPILNSFQKTVNKYSIPKKLISSFL